MGGTYHPIEEPNDAGASFTPVMHFRKGFMQEEKCSAPTESDSVSFHCFIETSTLVFVSLGNKMSGDVRSIRGSHTPGRMA